MLGGGVVLFVCCKLYGVWCMLYVVWCMLYGVWCMLYGVWCVVCGVCCMLYVVCMRDVRTTISLCLVEIVAEFSARSFCVIFDFCCLILLSVCSCKVMSYQAGGVSTNASQWMIVYQLSLS